MASRVLVDTSAWIDALRVDGDAAIREAVSRVTADGEAVLCDLVRLELWNSARGRSEIRMLVDLEAELECLPTTEEVWQGAIELARACRRRGWTVPATDLLVAACAEHHAADLLHHDSHFDQIARATRKSRD